MKYLILSIISTIILAQETQHLHKHQIDFILGGAIETKSGEKYGEFRETHVIGLEYQYHLNERWGIGAAIEGVGNQTEREQAYVIPITMHINHHWNIFAGPGYEKNDHHGAYLARVGTAYEYGLENNFNVSPKIMADFVESGGITWIVGIAIGYGF